MTTQEERYKRLNDAFMDIVENDSYEYAIGLTESLKILYMIRAYDLKHK